MTLARRFYGSLVLDAATYEDVEADPSALPQALAIVLAFSAAAAIGFTGAAPRAGVVVAAALASLAGWLSWAAIVAYLGIRVFPEPQTRSDVGELTRTLGFSVTPGLFLVLLAVPFAPPVTLVVVVFVWMLAAMIVAVRHALDFTHTTRAVGVCVAGWALVAALVLAAGFVFGSRVS
jgi:hypothetical protein